MIVSQLYTGQYLINKLSQGVDFLWVLSGKKEVSELNDGDSIMADKGFYIEQDLKKVGLQLNVPPFLEEKITV